MAGRFAPSPTGDLHLGNLRTAVAAWLAARAGGRRFVVRMEDLDRATSSRDHEQRQLDDLAALGLDWDGEVVRQSERFDLYRSEIERLAAMDLVYPCYCTRREVQAEIAAAASAPHGVPPGAYPGTCRHLTASERAKREAEGRPFALRLRGGDEQIQFFDERVGVATGIVDDVVLARADGVPAYNLAVVVDDSAQGVTQVVRGDDLLSSTPRQLLLQRLLGYDHPRYIHVPLVLSDDGQRLAKRHGAVTITDLAVLGWSTTDVLAVLARSLGMMDIGDRPDLSALIEHFHVERIPDAPVRLADLQRSIP